MAVPSSNIQLANDVYAEANGGYSSGQVELFNLGFQSYFNGPNGTNTIGYNAWGRGVGSGANRIYGTTATSDNMNLNGFAGLTYFYDQSNFQVVLNATNNIAPPPPPPPPQDNDLSIDLFLFDSTFTYPYLGGGSLILIAGGGNYNQDISAPSTPIIFRAYWQVIVSTAPNFGGGTVTIDINGTNYVAAAGLAAGPTPNTFDSATYGTADVASYGGFTGLTFDVTCN